jgi:hypothetical protein
LASKHNESLPRIKRVQTIEILLACSGNLKFSPYFYRGCGVSSPRCN